MDLVLPDARQRFMQACMDYHRGKVRIAEAYRQGRITLQDLGDRHTFLLRRYILAQEDFRRDRRKAIH